MRKTIIFYGRRNTGMCLLPYLVAKGYLVKIIPDADILWLAESLKLEVVTMDNMGEFDLFICCHGDKIIDEKYLVAGKMVNIHPCLGKYPGHNPIKKYIENKDKFATVESQYLIKEVDAGSVINVVNFETGEVKDYAGFYNKALSFYFRCLDNTLKILGI